MIFKNDVEAQGVKPKYRYPSEEFKQTVSKPPIFSFSCTFLSSDAKHTFLTFLALPLQLSSHKFLCTDQLSIISLL